MEKMPFRKLQLKKENIARMNKEEMQEAAGGLYLTARGTCGAMCAMYGPPEDMYNTKATDFCLEPDILTTYCNSFPNDPRNLTCVAGQGWCGTVAISPTCRIC